MMLSHMCISTMQCALMHVQENSILKLVLLVQTNQSLCLIGPDYQSTFIYFRLHSEHNQPSTKFSKKSSHLSTVPEFYMAEVATIIPLKFFFLAFFAKLHVEYCKETQSPKKTYYLGFYFNFYKITYKNSEVMCRFAGGFGW